MSCAAERSFAPFFVRVRNASEIAPLRERNFASPPRVIGSRFENAQVNGLSKRCSLFHARFWSGTASFSPSGTSEGRMRAPALLLRVGNAVCHSTPKCLDLGRKWGVKIEI